MAIKKAKSAAKPKTPIQKKAAAPAPVVSKPNPVAPKPSPMSKLSTTQKVGIGVAAVGAAVGVGLAAKKIFGGKRKRNQTQKLKSKIIRKQLKIKNLQLDRKLLREQLKGVM